MYINFLNWRVSNDRWNDWGISDVIPYGLSMGNRNNLMGLNLIGLRRSKVSNDNIKIIQLAYEIIFKTPVLEKYRRT